MNDLQFYGLLFVITLGFVLTHTSLHKVKIIIDDFLYEERNVPISPPIKFTTVEPIPSFFVIQDIHRLVYLKNFGFREPSGDVYNWCHDFRRAQKFDNYNLALSHISDIKKTDKDRYTDQDERFFNIIKVY